MLLKYWGTNLVRSVRNRGLENAIKNKTDKKKKVVNATHWNCTYINQHWLISSSLTLETKKKKNRTSAKSAPGTNTGAMTTTECHFTLNMPEFSNSQLWMAEESHNTYFLMLEFLNLFFFSPSVSTVCYCLVPGKTLTSYIFLLKIHCLFFSQLFLRYLHYLYVKCSEKINTTLPGILSPTISQVSN